jgi:uncharacterized membrane protein YphA (DoxX/SURF4 family)
MNIGLWIIQACLAVLFIAFGCMKLLKSKDELKGIDTLHYVDDFSERYLKLIGMLEVLGAMGLILPQLTGILPWLVTISSFGLVLTMLVAMIVHLRRGDGLKALMINVILLLMASFITYGRFDLISI